MTVHITPITLTVRGYDHVTDTDVPLHDLTHIPYNFICTIQIYESVAHLSGFMGKLQLSDFRDIKSTLRSYGVKTLTWRRNNRVKKVSL